METYSEQSMNSNQPTVDDIYNKYREEAMRVSPGTFPYEYLQSCLHRLACKDLELQERERQLYAYQQTMYQQHQHVYRGRGYRDRSQIRRRPYNSHPEPRAATGGSRGRYHRSRDQDHHTSSSTYQRRRSRDQDHHTSSSTHQRRRSRDRSLSPRRDVREENMEQHQQSTVDQVSSSRFEQGEISNNVISFSPEQD